MKQLTRNKVDDFSSTFSPDGKKVVFVRDVLLSNGSEDREIFIMKSDGTGASGLTFSSGIDDDPTFAPDGKIAFVSERDQVTGEI